MRFTKESKRMLRKLNVTAADVYKVNDTCYGTRYKIYNDYYLVDGIFSGYTKSEIYHKLVAKLFDKLGLDIPVEE